MLLTLLMSSASACSRSMGPANLHTSRAIINFSNLKLEHVKRRCALINVFICCKMCRSVCIPGLSGVIDGFRHLKQRETTSFPFIPTQNSTTVKSCTWHKFAAGLMFCSSIKQEPLHRTTPIKQPNAPLIFTTAHKRR